MKKFLKEKYSLSDKGVEDVFKSIISSALLNLALILPMMVSFTFLQQYINKYYNVSFRNFNVWHYIIIIIIAFVVMVLFAKYDYKKSFVSVYEESAKSRLKLAEKLKKLPLSYFGRKDVADLSATIMSDATSFEHLFSHSVPKVYGGLFGIVFMFFMLLWFDYRLALALFWVVPIAYLVFRLAKGASERVFKQSFDIDRDIIDSFQEGLNLVQEIKAYNREEHFICEIKNKYDEQKKLKIKTEVTLGSVMNISFILLKLGMPSVAIFGAYLFVNDRVDLFTYIVFLILSAVVFNPIMIAMMNYGEMLYLDSIVERIREINDMPFQEGSTEFEANGYDIVFENVDFSYEEGINVLKNVSFKAKQGEVTALVGPSGGGKTTAAKLSARFWDIDSGKISVGGVDISKIDPETLLKEFSIVFQDVALFNSSVKENIRLGRKDASDDEVMRVAKIARCEEFINKLPEGYDTLIGENGENLSGGERQRISIARALLKDAPIILLDESTASLDSENESKIQEGISELIKNKTVIIIAHRMRTVLDADNIIVIKDGEVAESGKPNDLILSDGIFASMYNMQMEVK